MTPKYTKFVQSGNLIEVYEYEKEPIQRQNTVQRRVKRGAYQTTFRSAQSLRRARQNFFRLVGANLVGDDYPAFFTFTMLEVVGIEEGYRRFNEFVRRFRSVFGSKPKYIAVPEFQERGAVHFHVLVWGLSSYEILKSIGAHKKKVRRRIAEWLVDNKFGIDDVSPDYRIQNLWGHGFVDCIPTDGSPRLAGYFAKYMYKSMQDERLLGKKAYSASRNILRSVSISSSSPVALSYSLDLLVDKPLDSFSEFTSMYLGRCHYKRYRLN